MVLTIVHADPSIDAEDLWNREDSEELERPL